MSTGMLKALWIGVLQKKKKKKHEKKLLAGSITKAHSHISFEKRII